MRRFWQAFFEVIFPARTVVYYNDQRLTGAQAEAVSQAVEDGVQGMARQTDRMFERLQKAGLP